MGHGKIKCTYKECFSYFETRESMIKHKKKDPEHAYCAKCDLDFEDDIEMMEHEIRSNKHSNLPDYSLPRNDANSI
jgi:hypothetical protein